MQNKFEKIAISVLAVAVLFLGIMFLFQQKTINQIKSDVSSGKNAAVNSLQNNPHADVNSSQRNSQNEPQRVFPGEIKAISGNDLEVDAKLVKVDDPSKLQAGQLQAGQYDVITKPIKVLLNDTTKYFGTKQENIRKEDLKVGDKMFVSADNSPLQAESLTALEIHLIDAWPSQLNQ